MEDPQLVGSIASLAIQPDVAQEHAGPQSKNLHTNIDHFNFLAILGKGHGAKIMLAENKSNKRLYAIKVVKKEILIENDEVEGPKIEKNVYLKAREHNHPFIAPLISTFQTETRLYFVLEYCPGGDLMYHIRQAAFGVTRSKFYGAEICLVLKFLHENGIIYRDLKLDNIMLTSEGHIQVFDFDTSAQGIDDHYGLTSTFCGTPEFMAPEILLEKGYGRAVDWWAFGILMYQMLFQQPPFRGEDEDEIYDAILYDEPVYPTDVPKDAMDLIPKLLAREPEERLGYHKGAEEIMNHQFFNSIDWGALYRKEVTPPFRPAIKDREDLSNFDTEFTSMPRILTPVQSVLTQTMQEQFRGFSFSNI